LDPIFATAISVTGLAFGSFLNVCIYRLPRGLSVVHPGSACPECRQPIRFYDNIPLLSWIALGGHCRNCRAAITPRYAIVEVLTAVTFLLCYLHFGLTIAALKYCVFGFLLLGLIFTDAETQLLPDKLTLTGLLLGLGFSLAVPVNDLSAQLLPAAFSSHLSPEASWRWFSLCDALLGAIVGASFLYGAGAIYLRARGVEGMGFGDVKLMGMIGAFLGVKLTVFTIFTASLAGSLFGVWTVFAVWTKRTRRRRMRHGETLPQARERAWKSARVALQRHQMPFGVFLGGTAIVACFFGQQFLHWYWSLL
jgi:leader peptidase (prepilin peptidase)/N-methyltransferase